MSGNRTQGAPDRRRSFSGPTPRSWPGSSTVRGVADELDDAVQEVFLVVHRNGGYEQGPATPRSYLASIAVRAASSYRRRGKARADRRAAVSPERVARRGVTRSSSSRRTRRWFASRRRSISWSRP